MKLIFYLNIAFCLAIIVSACIEWYNKKHTYLCYYSYQMADNKILAGNIEMKTKKNIDMQEVRKFIIQATKIVNGVDADENKIIIKNIIKIKPLK